MWWTLILYFFSRAFAATPQEIKLEALPTHKSQCLIGPAGMGVYGHRADRVKSVDLDRSTEAELRPGAGAMAMLPLNDYFSVEADLFYLERQYKRLNVLEVISERQNLIQLPVLVKFWPWSFVEIGAGIYASYAVGQVRQISRQQTVLVDHEKAGLKKWDYGVLVSGGFKIPLFKDMALITESRYLMGMANVSQNSDEERKFRELQFIVGGLWQFEGFL